MKKVLTALRARQIEFFQGWADNAQPNDTAMAFFVASILGVKVSHTPMKHSL